MPVQNTYLMLYFLNRHIQILIVKGDTFILALKLNKRHWTIIFLIILAIILYFILPISIPLIVALFTAMLLNPLVRFLQKRVKVSRKVSVMIVFVLFLLLIGFASAFVVTKAIGQVINFVEDVPKHLNQLNAVYMQWEIMFQDYTQNVPPEFIKQFSESLEGNLDALTTSLKNKITLENIAQFSAKIPEFLISFIVYLIALFLFMIELPLLKEKFYNLLTDATKEKVAFMNERLYNVLFGFLKAQFLVSVIIFIVTLICLVMIGPDVAILMSLMIWIVDLLPIIGSIIILAPWALYMFLVGSTMMGIKLSILAIILLAIRRTVEPKLMGQQIGLSPLATLIAMFIGLKLIGVLGRFGVPLLVIAISSALEARIIKWEIKI